MASVGAPRYNFRLRRRESVSLVETQPQKTRQTSNMDTFTTAGEAADEERHLQSSLVLNAYHRRSIDAVSVSRQGMMVVGSNYTSSSAEGTTCFLDECGPVSGRKFQTTDLSWLDSQRQ